MEELQAGVKSASRLFTWEEIKFFSGQGHPQQERWLVIDRKVYDIGKFYHHHPGGSKVIRHYTGQDATDAFVAFHPDKALVRKYMRSLLIGKLAPDQPSFEPHKNKLLVQDFRELCSTVERMGLLKPSGLFFFLNFLQIPLFQAASWLILWYFRMSLMSLVISAVLMATSMQQCLVLQHDLGHLSVFCKTKWNHLAQFVVMGSFAGFSCSWWNHLHGQHHAKTNCFRKDPDVNLHPFLFTLGKKLSVELGMKKKKFLPYNHQHKYFFITVPPFLFSTYIQFYTFYHIIQRKQWLDLACVLSYFIWLFLLYKPLLELKALLGYIVLIRVLNSIWTAWVTQMSHIPMNIDYDKNMDWFSTQLQGTCNVHQSIFNDWFTGHLNFQIEHHLFPRMPRHNFYKVAPMVKSLCVKHGAKYHCKPLLTAFADIVWSLKESGDLWLDAYLHK
ncbi:acyl-CoA (8-3)-desaturase isoform X1 [Alligator mississippiensis]|uniref:Cytochrome b5 heme-binding domain-containing protein n=1 Tax=Alligator mississippiensis TaxID=8496 RepID=A0A151NXQ3_ALLMI|nr:acyl-CoA (8-3)-desaturase isoform X1 [Alligator mississippiensis]KYO41647.1 hypothetical protein Y1Q_0006394 [Alligator mississippiensis]